MDDWERAEYRAMGRAMGRPGGSSGGASSTGSRGRALGTSMGSRDICPFDNVSRAEGVRDPPWLQNVKRDCPQDPPWATTLGTDGGTRGHRAQEPTPKRGLLQAAPPAATSAGGGGPEIQAAAVLDQVDAARSWKRGKHVSLADKDRVQADKATELLWGILRDLESLGLVVGIREMAGDDSNVSLLLRPRRPGTVERHVRMWWRFRAFLQLDMQVFPGLPITRARVLRWFKDLMSGKVGSTTLASGMGMFSYIAHCFDVEIDVHESAPLHKLAKTWREDTAAEVNRAPPYPVDVIRWLEECACDTRLTAPDRLLVGRLRVAVGASIRNDDMKRTPVGRTELVLHPDGSLRGIRTRAARTKTKARPWVCSSMALSPQGAQWLRETLSLLQLAHGAGWATDDHLGKRPMPDCLQFDTSPPDGAVDAAHLRLMMQQAVDPEGAPRFSHEMVVSMRLHGCKATLISAGIHLNQTQGAGDQTTTLRHQGGWQGRAEETMPDTYLRESQVLALEFQERVLRFLQMGNSVLALDVLPMASGASVPEAPAQRQDDAPVAVSLASSSSSSSVSSSVSDQGEEGDKVEAEGVTALVCTLSTGRFHAGRVTSSGVVPECGRRAAKSDVIQDGDIVDFLDLRRSIRFACEVCFPAVERSMDQCKSICCTPVKHGFVGRDACISRPRIHASVLQYMLVPLTACGGPRGRRQRGAAGRPEGTGRGTREGAPPRPPHCNVFEFMHVLYAVTPCGTVFPLSP